MSMTENTRDDVRARLFVALWPSTAVRARMAAHQHQWGWPPGAAPVARERLHLTLHFLGAVPRQRVAQLQSGLGVPVDPFELQFERAELWRGGVAVLRPAELPLPLVALRERLNEALEGLQQPFDAKPFKPHVTLARRAHGAIAPGDAVAIRWPVRGYALVESQAGPQSGYRVLRRFG